MDKQWIVYIVQCRDNTLYTGITDNLLQRLSAHNAGKGAKYTRGRSPVKVVHTEVCADKSQALRREAQIKRLTRTEKLVLCGSCNAEG